MVLFLLRSLILMEEITAEWLNIAEEDYKMARTAFRAKRYPPMLVFCQQTLEKSFKAYYYEKNRKTPPYKHDLIALAKDTGLLSELSQDWTGFLAEVSQCYFTARYPDKYKEITLTKRNPGPH